MFRRGLRATGTEVHNLQRPKVAQQRPTEGFDPSETFHILSREITIANRAQRSSERCGVFLWR
jgi:hypothetical protein